MNTPERTPGPAPLLEVEHLRMLFPARSGTWGRAKGSVHAVDDVTFGVGEGETLGLVGESGCGKTSLARCVVRLDRPTSGRVRFDGTDVTGAGRGRLRAFHQQVQMVFQDPQGALNPRKRVEQIVGAGLRLRDGTDRPPRRQVLDVLAQVGLGPEQLRRYPHELAGGQRQRVGLARALAAGPRLVVLDEPVSALDVSVRAQVINLLDDLQDGLGLSYLFVTHDLGVVRHVADRVAVMYLGKLVELSPTPPLFHRPFHPYTASLLAAEPLPDPLRRAHLRPPPGEPPSPLDPPRGCRFHPRCPAATGICREVEPGLTEYPGGRLAACHHPDVTAAELVSARRSPASPHAAGPEPPVRSAPGGGPG